MKTDFYVAPGPVKYTRGMAARAERLGYDGLFTADTAHDPFLPLVTAAAETERIELGTAIAVAFARSPMTVAYTAWDLAALADGRFLLGLGTQIRAHITRRFSMPWGKPGPQMREYIAALRAIWDTFQTGTKLDFEGDYYSFRLMTPFFDPGPIAHPDIPIYVAGVGQYMSRLAGEVCQGFHAHPFHTVKYLDDVVLPAMSAGAAKAGRSLSDVEFVVTTFVITGHSEEEIAAAVDATKQQIAFYASTPAYAGVLEAHGWDFGPTLNAMSKRGEWMEMLDLITDDVLDEIAITAPIGEIGDRIRARYGDRVQRVGLYTVVPPNLDDDGWEALVADIRG
ncbi:MAG: TIGR03617 family F420-dependent LLM class oxidoreductase [Acidimicrobiia bacterium]|nr:TIGR03617 family F420-dependent LLM class oxidoreductase [Acidimicrobiia bacterium]